MDKFLSFVKLNDEDDEYDDSDYYDEDEEDEVEEIPVSKFSKRDSSYEEEKKVSSISKITPLKSPRRSTVGSESMKVCVIRPTSVENGREITETLLDNRTVVMNLEGLDHKIAQRVIDFASGSCFAMGGNLQKISQYIFIITPNNVDLTGDFQDLFADAFDVKPLKDTY